MSRCEDYPACGHVDGLPCDWTPDYEYIYAHAGCEHEAGYCAVREAEWDAREEVDPEDCEHGDASHKGYRWRCDICDADLVMVTDVSSLAYPSKVVPGLWVEIPVLGWHFEVAA